MASIKVLSEETIDRIAAGEVVERPASVVKELVENAVDAGAGSVAVEIKDGGITLIRVTDNGCGIEREQVRSAFLRHATSKIKDSSDLIRLHSLGFRGEALSSIAAVGQVEVITKTAEELTGTRLRLEGGREKEFEEVGAPEGTTILVRNLFFNTPVRRKFLKSAAAEGGAVAELMEHLALGNPQVAFQFQQNGKLRFATSGNGDLKEVIYRIYGRETASQLSAFHAQEDGLTVSGYLGKPVLTRANRNFEQFFLNGRYIKDSLLAKALEEGYGSYLMQHKYPFAVLHLSLDPALCDVNVHPAKLEVRFSSPQEIFEQLSRMVSKGLSRREMIPEVSLREETEKRALPPEAFREKTIPEAASETVSEPAAAMPQLLQPFENNRRKAFLQEEGRKCSPVSPVFYETQEEGPAGMSAQTGQAAVSAVEEEGPFGLFDLDALPETADKPAAGETEKEKAAVRKTAEAAAAVQIQEEQQLELFQDKILTKEARQDFTILGQLFETYWLIEYQDKLLIVDQHAAHEKVKYERLVKSLEEGTAASQQLLPPVVLQLSGRETVLLEEYGREFQRLGFELEPFGGGSVAIRSVPCDLYGCGEKELFLEVLDELAQGPLRGNPAAVTRKLASMACKAAVKGNNRLSHREMEELLNEMLMLENPYHCPHGRPTMISMTKEELEKKFKRIVS